LENDAYYTLKESVSNEIRIKGSRFIGHAGPVHQPEEAVSFLNRLIKQYHDATHHCYAYRLGIGDESVFRYSDAGEPSGTAGKSILNVMDGRSLSDLICVVVRYFGGVKLGIGGLARAYAECATITLGKGVVETCFQTEVNGFRAQILESRYGSQTEMAVQIHKSEAPDFRKRLLDETGGRIELFCKEVKNR
jgi:putative IMPACT (imprinted ancient) family translation regulator